MGGGGDGRKVGRRKRSVDTEKRHSILDYTIHSYSIPGRNASLQNTSKALAHTTQSTVKTTTSKQMISLHIS